MQNRLDSAAEARTENEKKLAEVQAAITAELVARPKSVNFFIHFHPSLRFFFSSCATFDIIAVLLSAFDCCRIDATLR